MVRNEHILYFRLLDPRMVDSSIMFTKYESEWATNLRAISLNIGVTTFGPPCSFRCFEFGPFCVRGAGLAYDGGFTELPKPGLFSLLVF